MNPHSEPQWSHAAGVQPLKAAVQACVAAVILSAAVGGYVGRYGRGQVRQKSGMAGNKRQTNVSRETIWQALHTRNRIGVTDHI